MLKFISKRYVEIRKKLQAIKSNSEPFQTKIIVNGILRGNYIKRFETRGGD